MAKNGKHSKSEIAAKLAQAVKLATQRKLQSEIAQTLGVSVMSLHRWRKMSPAAQARANGPGRLEPATHARVAELQLENLRLRRLVADLLLEKAEFEEAFQGKKAGSRQN